MRDENGEWKMENGRNRFRSPFSIFHSPFSSLIPHLLSSMTHLSDKLIANTAALSHVLAALFSASKEQERATRLLDEERLREIYDERQLLSKALAALLSERRLWRETVENLPDGSSEKSSLRQHLVEDDALLSDCAQQVLQAAQHVESLLQATIEEIRAQLQTEHHRGCLTHTYHNAPQPQPRFVDRINTA
jgi:hypothetical protein